MLIEARWFWTHCLPWHLTPENRRNDFGLELEDFLKKFFRKFYNLIDQFKLHLNFSGNGEKIEKLKSSIWQLLSDDNPQFTIDL